MNDQPAYIVVMRPDEAGAALCAEIEKLGLLAYHFPVIAFRAVTPDFTNINQQDWLIFNSPRAVRFALAANMPRLSTAVKVIAIGGATELALQQAGINVTVVPKEASSEGLLSDLALQQIKDQAITVVRGSGGREFLEKVLRERGATVSSCITYQRELPNIDPEPCRTMLAKQQVKALVAGSFETVINGKQLLGESAWPQVKSLLLLVMSERIKKLAAEAGFQTIWVAETASNQAFLDLILKHKESICQSNNKKS